MTLIIKVLMKKRYKIFPSKIMKENILNTPITKRAFSISEAADYACVSRATLRNWIIIKLLPCEELPGRGDGSHKFRLIRKQDLDLFLNENYHDTNNKSINNNSDKLILMEK